MRTRIVRAVRLSVGLMCAAIALLLLTVPPADARGGRGRHDGRHHFSPARHHVIVGIGPWWWGPYPYWWYYPPYYAYPPTVVVEEPPIYVQQQPAVPPLPPAAEQFWYYCQSSRAYYPTVQTCAEDWVKVPPRQ